MVSLKLLSITETDCCTVFEKEMVYFWGEVEMCNNTHDRYNVLFNCGTDGKNLSARVYDECLSFRFIDETESVYNLQPMSFYDVKELSIESKLKYTNNVTLLEKRIDK